MAKHALQTLAKRQQARAPCQHAPSTSCTASSEPKAYVLVYRSRGRPPCASSCAMSRMQAGKKPPRTGLQWEQAKGSRSKGVEGSGGRASVEGGRAAGKRWCSHERLTPSSHSLINPCSTSFSSSISSALRLRGGIGSAAYERF